MPESPLSLAALKQRIATIENRRPPAHDALFALGVPAIDAALGGGLGCGRLHEIYAASAEDSASAAGFAMMLAMRAAPAGTPLLWLRRDSGARLHPPGMAELGVDPARLILVVAPDLAALLKAAADSLRCAGLGAVVIEPGPAKRGLDLTASRRLALATEQSGVTALLLPGALEPPPSAAQSRWRLASATSTALPANAPGTTMLDLELCAIARVVMDSAGAWSGTVTDRSSAKRRYLALFFPHLPADRLSFARAQPDPGLPFAFVEKVKGAIRLAAVDRQALGLGLVPGLNLADARARIPELVVFDHDPAADTQWLERLADGCERYTPMVAVDGDDGLLLDITGCAHLFGDEAGLAADVEQRLARAGLALRTAFGPAPEAAHALARFQSAPGRDEAASVRRLPVAALEPGAETEIALRRAGLKTIADLAERPVAALAARFGAEMTDRLARILGRTDSRITPRRPLPALRVERRFAEPIAHSEVALATLAELAGEAGAMMQERSQGGRHFAARLFRSDGQVRDLAVETGLPSRDPQLLDRLFRERIDALADPIDPGFGFDLIQLGIGRLEPLAPSQLRLEGGAVAEGSLDQLIDRLSTRLGRGRVRRFVARDTHVPEQAVLALPAIEAPMPLPWGLPEPGEPPARPLHLFDPPQPIEVMAEVPDGPPRRFRWQRKLHDVARFEGPERIAPPWWRLPPGEDGLTRDYYRVEDMRGRRFWIFRHGLFGTERATPGWYMHGLFA